MSNGCGDNTGDAWKPKKSVLYRAAVSLHTQCALELCGLETDAVVKVDTAAARGIANREGVGGVRAFATRVLWDQQAIRRGSGPIGGSRFL